MPFNIDLTSTKVPVKLQIVKNVINVYFYGEGLQPAEAREKWIQLNRHIEIPEYKQPVSILPASTYHRKKEHTNERETTIMHSHLMLQTEVTPEILSNYLNKLYQQQLIYSEEYRFFASQEEVDRISETFAIYYKSYKGSSIEAEYEAGTKLTDEEEKEYKEEIAREKVAQANTRLFLAALLYANSPIYSQRPNRQAFIPGADENINGCPIS